MALVSCPWKKEFLLHRRTLSFHLRKCRRTLTTTRSSSSLEALLSSFSSSTHSRLSGERLWPTHADLIWAGAAAAPLCGAPRRKWWSGTLGDASARQCCCCPAGSLKDSDGVIERVERANLRNLRGFETTRASESEMSQHWKCSSTRTCCCLSSQQVSFPFILKSVRYCHLILKRKT